MSKCETVDHLAPGLQVDNGVWNSSPGGNWDEKQPL